MSLLPTRAQWRRWSLPTRTTAIGALIGILTASLSIGVTIFYTVVESDRDPQPPQLGTPKIIPHSGSQTTKRDVTEVILERLDVLEVRLELIEQTMQVFPDGASSTHHAGPKIGAIEADLVDLESRFGRIEAVILEDPASALSSVLLTQQVKELQLDVERLRSENSEEVGRIYSYSQWLLALLFTVALGILGLSVPTLLNLVRANAIKTGPPANNGRSPESSGTEIDRDSQEVNGRSRTSLDQEARNEPAGH